MNTERSLSKQNKKQTLWSQSASELYRPSDRRLSPKLVPTFADRGCHVVSVTDPYGCSLGFLDRSRYFAFQVAPQEAEWTCRGNQHSKQQRCKIIRKVQENQVELKLDGTHQLLAYADDVNLLGDNIDTT
jgi:hypothetical protein